MDTMGINASLYDRTAIKSYCYSIYLHYIYYIGLHSFLTEEEFPCTLTKTCHRPYPIVGVATLASLVNWTSKVAHKNFQFVLLIFLQYDIIHYQDIVDGGHMSKFKNSMGGLYLLGLFYETVLADKTTVSYTLKDEDHMGFPSLKRLYLEMADPTEYKFAQAYMEHYAHWKRLTECTWFQEYILAWRDELTTKLRNRYISQIEAIASQGGREAFAANRYLLESLQKPTGAVSQGVSYRGSSPTSKTHHEPSLAEIEKDAKRLLS